MSRFNVRLSFHGDLRFFLKTKRGSVHHRTLGERTSIKDIIEACGVPHTEVDLILLESKPARFQTVLAQDTVVDVYGLDSNRVTLFPEDRLQVLQARKFIADGHLGKLVRDLRLLGIDVTHDRDAEDRALVKAATEENRGLLTRDRRLLMHSVIRHGYYLRSQNPLEQTVEVLRRFDLGHVLAPFSRCLRCNTVLESAEKETVIEQLEPLTKIYYDRFRRCPGCGQVYWSGSHFDKLQRRIKDIQSGLQERSTSRVGEAVTKCDSELARRLPR